MCNNHCVCGIKNNIEHVCGIEVTEHVPLVK